MRTPIVCTIAAIVTFFASTAIAQQLVCLQNSHGQTLRLTLEAQCTLAKDSQSGISGRWYMGGTLCNGRPSVPVVGACFGAPREGEVRVQLQASSIDPEGHCAPVMWNMAGYHITNLTGFFQNGPYGRYPDGSDEWTLLRCDREKAIEASGRPNPAYPPTAATAPGRP